MTETLDFLKQIIFKSFNSDYTVFGTMTVIMYFQNNYYYFVKVLVCVTLPDWYAVQKLILICSLFFFLQTMCSKTCDICKWRTKLAESFVKSFSFQLELLLSPFSSKSFSQTKYSVSNYLWLRGTPPGCFFCLFWHRENNLCDILFASLCNLALSKLGLLLKERILSFKS